MLSYHLIDLGWALRLATDLRNMGWPIWLDRLDVASGQPWLEAHEDMLNRCSLLLVLFSADYVASSNAMRIMQSVLHRLGPQAVLPVLVRPVPPIDWPASLSSHDFLDLTDPQADYGVLLSRIAEYLATHGLFITPIRPELRLLNDYSATIEQARSLWEYVRLSYHAGRKTHTERLMPPSSLDYDWWGQAIYIDHGPDGLHPQPIHDLVAFVQQQRRCLLSGPLGSGKTSTLHSLAQQAVSLYRQDSRSNPWPCLLPLSLWQPDQSVEDFFSPVWPFRSSMLQEARQGRVVFLLDGLDEMGSASERQRQALADWLRDVPCSVVITCDSSLASLAQPWGLRLVSMQPASEASSAHLLQVALGHSDQSSFRQVAQPDEVWRDFLRSPLHARLATFVYRHSPQASLHPQLGLLLLRTLELLWEREQLTHHPQWIPLDDALPALARLAFHMIREGRSHSVSASYAQNFFAVADGCAVALSAHILSAQPQERVAFSHPAWLAFLSAWHILAHDTPHAYITRLSFDSSGCRSSTPWDKSLMLLASLLEDASVFLEELAQVDPLLASACLPVGVVCSTEARQLIVDQLMMALAQHPAICWPALYEGLQTVTAGAGLSALFQVMRDDPQGMGQVALQVVLASTAWGAWYMPHDLPSLLQEDSLPLAQAEREALLPPLLACVASSDPGQALNAVRLLAQAGDLAALPSLLLAWPSSSPQMRSALIDAFSLLRAVTDDGLGRAPPARPGPGPHGRFRLACPPACLARSFLSASSYRRRHSRLYGRWQRPV